jgi:hypothetical protein
MRPQNRIVARLRAQVDPQRIVAAMDQLGYNARIA